MNLHAHKHTHTHIQHHIKWRNFQRDLHTAPVEMILENHLHFTCILHSAIDISVILFCLRLQLLARAQLHIHICILHCTLTKVSYLQNSTLTRSLGARDRKIDYGFWNYNQTQQQIMWISETKTKTMCILNWKSSFVFSINDLFCFNLLCMHKIKINYT